ncbi:MAG: sporulation protein YabP [Clostridia bacterium]|nr:sporulation protein YabP [Clostridia bacterium]
MRSEENRKPKIPHHVVVENRNLLTLTGIIRMGSFDEQSVVVYSDYGELHIRGERLHISKLSLESNEVAIDGEIEAMIYTRTNPNSNFFSKIFR